MTFLEAAIELLRQSGAPLTVNDLTQRAVAQGLLTNPGRNPELSMQARLTTELRKAENTLLLADGDRFGLKRYDKPRRAAESLSPPPGKAVDVEPTEVADEEQSAGGEEGTEVALAPDGSPLPGKRRRRRRGGRGRSKQPPEGTEAATEAADDKDFPEAGTPEEAIMAEKLAAEAEAEGESEPVVEPVQDEEPVETQQTLAHFSPRGEDEPGVDLDAILAPVRRPRGMPEVLDEAALLAQYGDELAAVGGVPVPGEHVDAQTADEDRPLLPAIHGESDRDRRRRQHGGHERGRDRGRPERQDRPDRQGRPERGDRGDRSDRPRDTQAPLAAAPAAPPLEGEAARAQAPRAEVVGTLADSGVMLLKAIGDGRPSHVRQLAAMALKRRLASGDTEEVARALRAALLGDSTTRTQVGLRPRVRSAGSGSFALAARGLEQDVAQLEEGLAQRSAELARATRTALRRRLGRLALPALEQLAILFLERSGYAAVERVKRVDSTSYLMARGPGGAAVLVGVRAGDGEAGRRAVGELRAGVVAKQATSGLLLSAARLGEEGLRELGQAVPPVTAFDGDLLAEAMIDKGVGVIRTAIPVAYLDLDALSDLVE